MKMPLTNTSDCHTLAVSSRHGARRYDVIGVAMAAVMERLLNVL